jgi:processed acidic surface protein
MSDNWRKYMNKLHYILTICTVLLVPSIVIAAPPEEELQQYLHKMEWSKEELTNYLKFHNLSLENYETMDELIEVLGTPINDSNIQNLLDHNNLTRDDLDDLLEQYGETTEDYTFIEDLNTAVTFFKQHNKELSGLTEFLSYVGVTNEEMSLLMDHIVSLNQQTFLSKIKNIDDRIEKFGPIDETSGLSETQQKELLSIFQEVLSAYSLNPTFQVSGEVEGVVQTMTFQQLTDTMSLKGKDITVALYTEKGEPLVDMSLSSDMLSSDFVLQTSEQLVNAGQIATSMDNLMNGDPLPVTASTYPIKILFGAFLLVLSGTLFYFYSNRKSNHT